MRKSSYISIFSALALLASCTVHNYEAPPATPVAFAPAPTPATPYAPTPAVAPTAPPPAPIPVATVTPAPTPAPQVPTVPSTPLDSSVTNIVSVGGKLKIITPVGKVAANLNLRWGNFTSTSGEQPANTQCVPESTKELCWDGIDNNCNGEIDEGCPYQSGPLQFTVAWRFPVDLDLHVVGPDNIEVNRYNRVSIVSGLMLDKDCQGFKDGVDNCPDGKVENIFLTSSRAAMRGRYRVWVELSDSRGQIFPMIPFTFAGRVGTQVFNVRFQIPNQKGARKEFSFDVL